MNSVLTRDLVDLSDEERVHLIEVAREEYALRYGRPYAEDDIEFDLNCDSRVTISVFDAANKPLFKLVWSRNGSGHLKRVRS